MSLSLAIKERALAAGFDLAGIVLLDALPSSFWDDLSFARRWVAQGYGGEMHYLENPKRRDPRRILPAVKSVICMGLIYNAPLPYSTEMTEGRKQEAKGRRQRAEGSNRQESAQRVSSFEFPVSNFRSPVSNRAWISRYAWGGDYHEVMRTRLERLRAELHSLAPGVETRVYVDTGPIVERALARYSGIGWMGKNTCLIDQQKGSWFFLGVILTSVALEPDLPAADRCGSCTRCIEACPTGALVQPYVMDASRCISYFTIELKGSIPSEFRSAIGRNVFGCDICQDVCPWNSNQWSVVSRQLGSSGQASAVSHQPRQIATTDREEFQPLQVRLTRPPNVETTGGSPVESAVSLFNPSLEALADLSEEDFKRIFSRSPIKRAKYRGWLRNLCVVMGNSGDTRFVPWLERTCGHADAVVREHAAWALHRLQGTGNSKKKRAGRPHVPGSLPIPCSLACDRT